MPKIDWFDNADDLPRRDPTGRPRRERAWREGRERRMRLEHIMALAAAPPQGVEPPARRPLHLIWGPPNFQTVDNADQSGS